MKKGNMLKGVIVPVITPVDGRDRVDEENFRKLIQYCIKAGVNGLFVGGSAGMGPLLTEKEWQRAMEIAYDEIDGKSLLLGGVIAPSTEKALLQIGILERIGYENMVVTPTFYITLKYESEFLAHFGRCREATDMNMIVYNIPLCTGSTIPVETILEMVRRGWTNICKESSDNREYFLALLKKGRELGLRMFQGSEPNMGWGLLMGASGIVPVCANYSPKLFVEIWRAAQEGDQTLLRSIQKKISAMRKVILLGEKNWIAGIMYAVSTLGIGRGRPVEPLQELSVKEKELIDKLGENKNIMV